jgi:hypothetical protein
MYTVVTAPDRLAGVVHEDVDVAMAIEDLGGHLSMLSGSERSQGWT